MNAEQEYNWTYMTQTEARKKIEVVKEDFRKQLEEDTLRYKRAIIRELDYLWRNKPLSEDGEKNIAEFAEFILQRFDLPKSVQTAIINELKDTQTKIADTWDEYFSRSALADSYKSIDYEKIIAANQVDFPNINSDIRDLVVSEVRKSARNNYNFETLRANLQKTTIGTNQIYTLANTAVSQFDNASMFEFALQAGINEFLYDGVLHRNSRLFCIMHIGHIYTYDEILQMDNSQGVPVVTSCGGYNCIHFWSAHIKGVRNVRTEKSATKIFGPHISPGNKKELNKYSEKEYMSLIENVKKFTELEYSDSDLKQDLLKHASEFGYTETEYIEKAKRLVKEADNIMVQIYKGNPQLLFFGGNGYVVADPDGTIRGYYEHPKAGGIEKTFENLKRNKLWLRTKEND